MSAKLSFGGLLIALLFVTGSLVALAVEQPPGASAREQGVREREGGRAVPRQFDQGQAEATEEGMPSQEKLAPGARAYVWPGPRWWLGVHAYNTPTGVVITQVRPGSPAWSAGLERRDRIVSVDGFQVGYVDGRVYYLGEELQVRGQGGGHVTLLVQNWRNDQLLNIGVQLQRGPLGHRDRGAPRFRSQDEPTAGLPEGGRQR